MTQLFKLGHYAICNTRYAFGIEAIHHAADEVELVLKAEVDEVGVDEDTVGRD